MMTLQQLLDHLTQLLADDPHAASWPVFLTDIADNGGGYIYEPVDVDLITGESDEWVGIDMREADLP